ILVPTHPEHQRHSFGLSVSRHDKDYVEVPCRSGFGSESNRESPDEGVAEPAGPEVGIQPDQGFLEASQRGPVPLVSGTYGRFSNHALKRCRISSSLAWGCRRRRFCCIICSAVSHRSNAARARARTSGSRMSSIGLILTRYLPKTSTEAPRLGGSLLLGG